VCRLGGTKGALLREGDYILFYGKGNEYHQLETGFFVQHRIVLAAQRVKSVSDRMPYIVLTVHWCNIVMNVHAPGEEKCDDSKDSFYEQLEQVFDDFPKHHIKILLENLMLNWG
jgi:hypothetical protein